MEVKEVKRKKTPKHMKTEQIGVKTSVQFENEWVIVTMRIPRKRLTQRLSGRDLGHLKRYGLIPSN